jgi:hypothetical protein
MEERRRKNTFCGHCRQLRIKGVDRCGLSAMMQKNADKLGKNADKLQTFGNEKTLTWKGYV